MCGGSSHWSGTWGGQYDAWYPTTYAGSYNTFCELRLGSYYGGTDVLQSALNYCYDAKISVDGIIGSRTERAMFHVNDVELDVYSGSYSPTIRRYMDWPNWHYASGSWHYHCIDNNTGVDDGSGDEMP